MGPHRNSTNLLQLLHRRERYGTRDENTVRFSSIRGPSLNSRVHCRELSILSAWNPKRLQNMILAVGPLTPAFVLNPSAQSLHDDDSSSSTSSIFGNSSSSSSSSSRNHTNSDGGDSHNGNVGNSSNGGGNIRGETIATRDSQLHRTSEVRTTAMSTGLNERVEEEEEEKEEGKEGGRGARDDIMDTTESVEECSRESLSGQKRMSNRNSDEESSSEEHDRDAGGGTSHVHSHRIVGDAMSSSARSSSPSPSSGSKPPQMFFSSQYKPAISHSGCINTASWMDCSWRLSTVKCYDDYPRLDSFIISSSHSSNSNMFVDTHNQTRLSSTTSSSSPMAVNCTDCPTQIVTSGDDRIVKFWDCSQSMGSVSPIPCPATQCPFAYSGKASSNYASSRTRHWRKEMDGTTMVPGLVQFLGSMRTGHRGNVFHASPLVGKPGQVMTCAADGKLDVCDIVQDSISTVLSLDGMLFSHLMLDEHIGLVCGESGLHRFDLRVPRSSQPSSSLFPTGESCKSCAVYSAAEAETSAYVFAGKSSQVELYDLRFLSDSARTIQTFQPSCLTDLSDVSVSGIDVSKDRKELLVSYESDQIYTFPLFPSHISDPTTDDMISYSNNVIENPHFGAYGAHLNRFTFLKCAKYAGPNDEYICTGSDSGHAFIYEKYSGSVVSMLKADKSTCNGVVPHPTLPFFLTYGIDSAAKLWRASNPVDDDSDDSDAGRRRAFHEQEYTKSILVSRCSDVQAYLNKTTSDPDLKDMVVTLLPDEVALRSIDINGRLFHGLPEVIFRSLFHQNPFNPGSDEICNDLRNLPEVLKSNYYDTINAVVEDDEIPVRCGIHEFHRRISLIRLHHQSHQLGIRINPETPWNLKSIYEEEGRDDDSISPADFIPESPGDWLPYDGNFSNSIMRGGRALANDNLEDFYLTRYCRFSNNYPSLQRLNSSDKTSSDMEEDSPFDASKAWDILLDTITTLKEEGNTALQQGSVHLAARLYDKALAYCCAAFFNYPQSNLDFLSSHQKLLAKNAGHYTRWSPLLKAFISVRLNLSMTLLKPGIADIDAAHSQAYLALQDLRPFTKKAGIVLTGKRLQKSRQDEPIQTFQEAKELEAKAYFRLGSVKMQGRQFTSAMHMLEKCLQATKEYRPNSPPDRTVQHRLAEAKRLSDKERKKRRKQFRFAFGGDGNGDRDDKADHEGEEK